jgi:hypothetical protein
VRHRDTDFLSGVFEAEKAGLSQSEFEEKWNKLSLNLKKVLNCLACEGGQQVKEINIWRKLQRKYAFSQNGAEDAVREAKLQFLDTGLVIYDHNREEMTYHPTWRWYLARADKCVDQTII